MINFHGLNRHLSVLLDHLSLTLDRKREDKEDKEDKKASGADRRRLFEGCDYFKYFRPREAINRRKAIIRGNAVFT